MIHLDEARQYVLERCRRLAAAEASSSEAIGRVLAAEVVATENVPPFANSAVDGYAVIAADVFTASDDAPVSLRVIDEVAAGAVSARTVGPGQAIRIMTGAPMPAGADSAVMVEDTERQDGGQTVLVRRGVAPGAAVRAVADDVAIGDRVFPTGTVVTPAVVGVLASINARAVQVVPAARVAVLSTGDELVDDGRPLQPGQIRESNRTMLLHAVREAGAEPVDFGVVVDDETRLADVLHEAGGTCDAIVTSGGVSMGDYDVVKAVLARLAEMRWMQIAIKPAKPFAFGLLGEHRVPVFGLPGNPVSSLVSFELLARPALRQMMGFAALDRPTVTAVAGQPLRRRPDGKTHFVRGVARFGPDGRVVVVPVASQGSHQLAATALANALVELPDGNGVDAGGDVRTILLSIA